MTSLVETWRKRREARQACIGMVSKNAPRQARLVLTCHEFQRRGKAGAGWLGRALLGVSRFGTVKLI